MKARRARPAWARPAGTGTRPPETPSADARPPGLRRRGGPLRERDFRLLWVGETASAFGSSVTTVALPLVAITVLQANALVVGVLAAASWVPWVLIGLLGTVPLGALLGGALGDSLGVRPAMWIMTGGMTLTGLILLAGPLKRDRDLPEAPAVS
ncbi:hypothetical protein [Sphaerisporangium sp. NPDC051011]|uniref:hypothetical protein n=1 Tax=Sphaerisporangium sp. NPDC051011 TaxID=3155792 RepID=UPI0033CE08B0